MALPSSGIITTEDINLELSRAAAAPCDLTGAEERDLAGVPTGQILLPDDFYGKSSVVQYIHTITEGKFEDYNGKVPGGYYGFRVPPHTIEAYSIGSATQHSPRVLCAAYLELLGASRAGANKKVFFISFIDTSLSWVNTIQRVYITGLGWQPVNYTNAKNTDWVNIGSHNNLGALDDGVGFAAPDDIPVWDGVGTSQIIIEMKP